MRTPIPSRTPEQWLRSVGLRNDQAQEVLESFEPGASLEVCRYRSPHLFLRFHGRGSRNPVFRPNYWADGSALAQAIGRASRFEGFLDDDEIARIARHHYREITAICYNWNRLADDELWKIDLRGAETVEGLEGPVRAQPTHAADRRQNLPASRSMLRGGAVQVYLNPGSPFVCTPVDWTEMA